MWSGDEETSGDESLVEEELETAIQTNLKEPLSMPMSCPVCYSCSFAPNRFHRFPDYKALRQHASERARDRSREQVKVKHFHESLVRLIDKQMEESPVTVPITSDTKPLVKKEYVGEESARKVDDLLSLEERSKEWSKSIHDLQDKRHKKQRLTHKNTHKLQEYRFQNHRYRESSVRIAADSMKELEKHQSDLAQLHEDNALRLASRRSSIAAISKRLKGASGQMSAQEQADLTTKLMHLTEACQKLQQEKAELEKARNAIADNAAAAQQMLQDAARQAQMFEKQVKGMEEECTRNTELEKHEEEFIKALDMMGLDVARMARSCTKCRRRFDKAKSENSSQGTCQRAVLEECNCVEYCMDCASNARFKCLRHGSASRALPFQRYG